jgi:hypothetical protein
VLGIRDILVQIQIESGSPEPYLLLTDPDPDPTPDPTTFFNDFKDLPNKLEFFPFFSLITNPQVHHLQALKLNFLLKYCVKILLCQAIFQSAQHIYGKGKDPDPGGPTLVKSQPKTIP